MFYRSAPFAILLMTTHRAMTSLEACSIDFFPFFARSRFTHSVLLVYSEEVNGISEQTLRCMQKVFCCCQSVAGNFRLIARNVSWNELLLKKHIDVEWILSNNLMQIPIETRRLSENKYFRWLHNEISEKRWMLIRFKVLSKPRWQILFIACKTSSRCCEISVNQSFSDIFRVRIFIHFSAFLAISSVSLPKNNAQTQEKSLAAFWCKIAKETEMLHVRFQDVS